MPHLRFVSVVTTPPTRDWLSTDALLVQLQCRSLLCDLHSKLARIACRHARSSS
jgi:hypothetical protein